MLLDDALHHTLMRHILRIQSWIRCVTVRAPYRKLRAAVIVFQVITPKALCRFVITLDM